jgi:hypothetical protein
VQRHVQIDVKAHALGRFAFETMDADGRLHLQAAQKQPAALCQQGGNSVRAGKWRGHGEMVKKWAWVPLAVLRRRCGP